MAVRDSASMDDIFKEFKWNTCVYTQLFGSDFEINVVRVSLLGE